MVVDQNMHSHPHPAVVNFSKSDLTNLNSFEHSTRMVVSPKASTLKKRELFKLKEQATTSRFEQSPWITETHSFSSGTINREFQSSEVVLPGF